MWRQLFFIAAVYYALTWANRAKASATLPNNAEGNMGSDAARGIRNNNPLNIRVGNNWQGEATSTTEKAFEVFEHHKYGFRAGAILLRNYQRKYNLKSVSDIISRFAPPNENHTSNYTDFVANQLGVSIHQPLNLIGDDELLARMMHAMSIMEVGRHYKLSDAREGVALA